MDDFEIEEYIYSHLSKTNYFTEYELLEEMGFNQLMIKKVYAFINPKSIGDAIQFMSQNNNIYQHDFFPDKDNKCFYCKEEPKYHINYIENIKKENIIENELKDKIKLEDDYFEKEELDIHINTFDENTILEGEIGDKLDIDEETNNQLINKGKKATCKIFSTNENGNGITGSGFFCKIPYFNNKKYVLFTNEHILNEESIKFGYKIKLEYQNKIKMIEITNKRFYQINLLYDFTCIEILNEDEIEDFYEIEDYKNINNYNNEDIAIVQYPKGGPMKVKAGYLKKINNYIINHTVDTDFGSSGSPIILLSRNFKIIGIHRKYNEKKNVKFGSYIKNIIEYINKNEIICEYNITKE